MYSDYNNKSGKMSKTVSVFYYLISFIVLAITVGFYINNTVEVDKIIKQNKDLKEKLLAINQDNMHLKVEIEKLSSYERISKIASEKFNMIKIDSLIDKREITVPLEEKETDKKEN